MIDSVRARDREFAKYMIFVVEKLTAKIFSELCSMYELIQQNVYQLEKLELDRKPYQRNAAIYFVSEKTNSINRILKDFEDENNP